MEDINCLKLLLVLWKGDGTIEADERSCFPQK